MKTSRPIKARILPQAILHNYRLAKRHAPTAKAWAVIKANAYGHGQWRAKTTTTASHKSAKKKAG